MEFKIEDYYDCLIKRADSMMPKNPGHQQFIDIKRYQLVSQDYQSYLKKYGVTIEDTFKAIEKRTSNQYYWKVYSAQMLSLDYSIYSFPAYRFIMSDMLADDWLAIVDFHKKYCRDHAFHQPLVAYITAKMLGFGNSSESLQLKNNKLLDVCTHYILNSKNCSYLVDYFASVCPHATIHKKNKYIKTLFWKNLFYETAIMAAMFHDIGYPWQYINRLSESLHTADYVNHTFSDNASFVWKQFHNRLLMYPFFGYITPQKNEPYGWDDFIINLIQKSMEKTHGFPGAMGFMYLNDIIRKYPCEGNDAVRSFVVDWAALAIMMHDIMKVYQGNMPNENPENPFLKMRFDTDPLSCVVAIADFLEEFERPSLSLDTKKKGVPLFEYKHTCNSVEISCEQDKMIITIHYSDEKERIKGLLFKTKESESYFDSIKGLVDLTPIGISKVELRCTT